MFITLGMHGWKYGDGLRVLGVIISCIAHVQIVTHNVNVFLCTDDGIRTGRLGGGWPKKAGSVG